MRSIHIILFVCLMPVSGAYCAEDSGERNYPADQNPACLDRNMSSGSGGCITREGGAPRDVPPQALPSTPDTTRQSPPGSEATPPIEIPAPGGGNG